jgi:hypothetical protein
MDLVIYLVAFIVCVVMIIAQCQLFAIRALLETLVKQGGGEVPARPSAVTANIPRHRRTTGETWALGVALGIALLFVAVVTYTMLSASH